VQNVDQPECRSSRLRQSKEHVMKFMCLVHFEPTDFDGITEEEGRKLTDITIEQDHDLRRRGKLIFARPLDEPEKAVTVRVRKRRLRRSDGPFAEAKEWVGGFLLIEAADMDEAVAIAAECEIAKYGAIEIRALIEQTHSARGMTRPGVEPR
jgi:hypothetical protein